MACGGTLDRAPAQNETGRLVNGQRRGGTPSGGGTPRRNPGGLHRMFQHFVEPGTTGFNPAILKRQPGLGGGV